MATKLVAATNNRHKLAEMRRMLERNGYEVLSLADVGIHMEQPETGDTFAENAVMKAKMAAAASGQPAIGDDSGLCVDALDGAPGILSARFSGSHGDDEANNEKLLYLLERTPYAKRTAQMVCVLAIATPEGKVLQKEGVCEGRIGFAKSGEHGFGYDALFYVNNKSFAEMEDEEKDQHSHRAQALRALMEEMPAFLRGAAAPEEPAPEETPE